MSIEVFKAIDKEAYEPHFLKDFVFINGVWCQITDGLSKEEWLKEGRPFVAEYHFKAWPLMHNGDAGTGAGRPVNVQVVCENHYQVADIRFPHARLNSAFF